MARKLSNWLDAFEEWTLPRSEAPRAMIRWAGLFALSSVMKRKVSFPKTLMGSYEIYPFLFIIFVAKPGVVRKSTTVGYAEELLRDISSILNGEKITFAADVTSASKLMDAIANSSDNTISIVSTELSSLVQATPDATYQILTALFDNKKNFDWSTWAHGDKPIKNPIVNLFAATTPSYIAEQPPTYFSEGGFASRVIFIHELTRRRNKLYYDDVDQKKIEKLHEKLIEDLNHIASLKGQFEHDSKKTKAACEAWYQVHAAAEISSGVSGFAERKHVHAHKVAMLLSLAEQDDLKITKKHWDGALTLLNEIEEKIPSALLHLGRSPIGGQMDDVLAFVTAKGGIVSRDQIARRFYGKITSLDQLNSLLTFLVAANKLRGVGSTSNPKYEAVK